jgi:hypothetical protein
VATIGSALSDGGTQPPQSHQDMRATHIAIGLHSYYNVVGNLFVVDSWTALRKGEMHDCISGCISAAATNSQWVFQTRVDVTGSSSSSSGSPHYLLVRCGRRAPSCRRVG